MEWVPENTVSDSPQAFSSTSQQIDDAVRRVIELAGEPSRDHRESRSGLQIDYTALDSLDSEIRAALDRIDQPPPAPPTLRGRLGKAVIGVLRRAFWWQAHQFNGAFQALARQGSEERWVLERIDAAVKDLDRRLERLEGAQVAIRSLALDFARSDDLRASRERIEALDRQVDEIRAKLSELTETRRVVSEENQPRDKSAPLGRFSDNVDGGAAGDADSSQEASAGKSVRTPWGKEADAPPSPLRWRARALDYWEFQAAFRGTRDEIKERQKVYLPFFTGASQSPSQPVLDLGCGRGEWLELLSEAGIAASGVDVNEEMLSDCRARGLRVERGDALQRLRSTPSSSLGAVTAFHLVEHLSFDTLIELIDESVRVLRPGGLCLFETPNPANILVATQGFYLDPTHERPLPSPLLRYLVEARGFCDVRCEEVNPYPEWIGEQEEDSLEARFNRLVYGPRDYAVVASKP